MAPPEAVTDLINGITPPDSDERDRLHAAARDIPITSREEIQAPASNQVIGRRIFERELGDAFRVSGTAASPLSTWIREHLQAVDDDYPYQLWKRFVWFTRVEIPAYDAGGYDDLRQHLWKLDQAGLITQVRTEPTGVEGRPERRYYAVVDARLEDPAWANVTAALYGTPSSESP